MFENPVMTHHYLRCLSSFLLIATAAIQAQTICQIQGNGANSPYNGQQVTTEGVITAIFTGSGSVGGYFIEQPDCDADVTTSNGVLVYQSSTGALAVGQRVQVSGTVTEFNGLTEIINATAIVLGTGTVTPTNISLPIASVSQWEQYEGMLLRFPATLTVTDNQGWVQYGELGLAPDRVFTPTNFIDPNDAVASGTNSTGSSNLAAINAEIDLQQRSFVLLDDGRTSTYPTPLPLVGSEGTLRTGSTIAGLVGVLHYAFGDYRIQPVGTVPVTYDPRPVVPAVGGSVRAASMNLLNYFTTLGDWGAANSGELDRQRTKLLAAIQAMDADVYALHEVQNNDEAWVDLLDALNNAVGAGAYGALEVDAFGTGGTKSVIFYRTTTLTPITDLFSVNGSPFQRPHITQGFQVNADGGRFLFSTAHMRSKLCDNATGSNLDQNDGQGCFNTNRRDQANALLAHWEGIRNSTGIAAQLIMGDFNAYTEEDPLDVFRANGIQRLLPADEYSYFYQGTFGSLDHAFGTAALENSLSQAAAWHINSDEPGKFDYADANFSRYQPNAFRSSDHDPLVVGLNSLLLPLAIHQASDGLSSALRVVGDRTALWSDDGNMASGLRLVIYDALGSAVSEERLIGKGQRIDLSKMSAGVYLWRATGNDHRALTGRIALE